MAADSSGNVTASASQPPDLVSWWQAEGDASDALAVNNGSLEGNVEFVPGRVGQAFSFSGPPNDVLVPSSSSLKPVSVTVMAWVQHSGTPGSDQYVLSQGAKGCTAASYALYTGFFGGLRFYVYDGGGFWESPDPGQDIWDGKWHFVAGTYDGATARLYVDGVQVGQGTPANVPINYANMDNSNFYIGAYHGSCTLGFPGNVDEVKVFNRALSAAEILNVYQTTP